MCFFSKIWEELLLRLVEKLATNVIKKPGRALENTSNTATAAETKTPKAVLSSLPEVINSYYTGKGLYLRKFV